MITKEQIRLCAENITKSINIQKEDEFVYISGNTYSQGLLEEIGLCVYRDGGIPYISATSDY